MVAHDVGDDLDLSRIEGVERGVGDQVVAVLVVALVVDCVADVVEQGGVLQPFALTRSQAVERGRDVEQPQRQPGGLLGVQQHAGRALGELADLAAAHVGGCAIDGSAAMAASTRPSRRARSETAKRSTPAWRTSSSSRTAPARIDSERGPPTGGSRRAGGG